MDGTTGDFDVNCQVCGVKYDLVDTDATSGKATVTLTWGPNTHQGKFNESIIRGYAIFQVDADRGQVCSVGSNEHANDLKHVDLSQAIKEVPKRTSQDVAADGEDVCCVDNVYSETLSWTLPAGVSAVRLMISPVTTEGDVLPLGLTTGIMEDSTTPVTTTAAPVTTTTLPKARIVGKIVMQVADVAAFMADPTVKTAMAASIASMAGPGVKPEWVTVIITAARRLRGLNDEEYKRRLAGGGVNIEYTIDIPQGATVEASSITNAIKSTSPAAFLATVKAELTAAGSTQTVTSVESISAEEVDLTGTPKPRAAAPVVEEDDGAPVAGIVIGVLVAVFCVCGLAGAGFWYYKKQQSGPEEVEVQTRAVNVMPSAQPSRVAGQPVNDSPGLPGQPGAMS